MKNIPSQCPICAGKVALGKTTFTVDMNSGVVVVRNVSAFICLQCGEEWLDDEQSNELEKVVNRARQENAQLEMISMS